MREGNSFRQRKYAPDAPNEEQTDRLLTQHRQVQDELTDDLVRMAQVLKGNSHLFKETLEKDTKTMRDAQEAMGENQTRLARQGTRLGTYSKKAWGTTWLTWSIILAVCLLFMLVYFVIRLFPKRH
ncbi:hypothetical protein IWQ60_007787 [Tieghemiomyces parasiticus]|uniref:Vesicle transport protein USE1 n=1 Tax=Tieghemiomyces parasiticus TaxID=78921 RepID=A0A9W7ZWM7_9FUNG|nr:hypothetical protein IWQ60_008423 [Tieghemiomyces parasiticus]KAJ1917431.1 hypothetical protein IWQ60_007787 [Tieghemiomyces parasiticus]